MPYIYPPSTKYRLNLWAQPYIMTAKSIHAGTCLSPQRRVVTRVRQNCQIYLPLMHLCINISYCTRNQQRQAHPFFSPYIVSMQLPKIVHNALQVEFRKFQVVVVIQASPSCACRSLYVFALTDTQYLPCLSATVSQAQQLTAWMEP